jgi:hypothetical protein
VDDSLSLQPPIAGNLLWVERRLALLEAHGDYETIYALTAEWGKWLLGCPVSLGSPLLVPLRSMRTDSV